MNTSRLWRVSTLLLVMALASCDNERGLTAPPEVAEPSLGKIGDEQDPDAQRIESLIIALYPGPGLENEALVRWASIQRQLSRGQLQAARSQARALVEQVVDFAAAGRLEVPSDPMLPGTVDLAVTELVTRLFVFVGLDVSDALQEYSDDLPEDFGFGTVDPDEGGIITTSNDWAAVVAGPGVTDGVVFVTIELLDEEMCAVADPLTQALGCWNIERYPEGSFNEDVKVEICVADNPAMSDDEWDLLLVHRKADDGTVNPLPWSEPTAIDCTGFGGEGPQQTVHAGRVTSLLALARSRLADLLLPESLGASVMSDRPPTGLGGTTGVFSDFFGAVPASAIPNLVSWWTGDGDYFDLYGGNHGAPMGGVSFGTPAISGSAFQFDGDGDAVLITPLSDEVKNLQNLTLAAWIYLDPDGPADQIQHFVSLGHGKAVLRQEGGMGQNRTLHFYMAFERLPLLRHIWVNNAFQTGCFHFFAGTWDGSVMRAYLDGVERGSVFVPGGVIAPLSDSIKLGASGGPFAPAEFLTGALDEVMIFERALAVEELQAIYDAGGTQKCVHSTHTVSGTVRYSATSLAGIRVTLFPDGSPGSAVETYTDETGRYEFTGVAPGEWSVRAYGQGYPDPEDPDQYPFREWVGRRVTVTTSDQVADLQLPKTFHLLTPPDGATVNPQGLTLTWEPNAEAEAGGSYSITIHVKDQLWLTPEVGHSTEPSYQVQQALSPGTTYSWQVDAHDADGRWVGSTTDAFEYAIQVEGSWALAGNLLGPRRDHAALLLGDGTVLVNGGLGFGVELFDPETGTSTLLHSSSTRQGSTATLLRDGRVLRVGPWGTDIFNPATSTVTSPTAGPDGPREYHAAILLPDSTVLIAGGRGFDSVTYARWDRADAEIFDPDTDAFTTLTDSLSVARHALAPAVLPDGKVLLAGGTTWAPGAVLTVADIFDPATGVFTPTGAMNRARSGPIATLLPTGKVLITGGWYAQPELYDPASGTFSLTGPTNEPRWAHTATLLADGRVLLAGGVESGPVTLNSAEVYDPWTGTFTRVAWMVQARQQHSALLLPDGRVLVLGGFDFATNRGSDLATAEIFTPGGG